MPPIFPREKRRMVLWLLPLVASEASITGLSPSKALLSRRFISLQEALEEDHTPHVSLLTKGDSVCLIPLSIAFTNGISIDFFSSGY